MNINSNMNSVNTLFSSLNGANKSNGASSLFGGNTGLSGLLSDYSSIRNGSYGKLMKAYYSNPEIQKSNPTAGSTSTSKDTPQVISQLKSASDDLSAAAKDLYRSDSKSVFNKKDVTAEDGSVSKEYDKDAIYSAVSKFADKYNDMLVAANRSDNDSVVSSVAKMIKSTVGNSAMLDKIGISIDSKNYQMSVDEDKFKKADMSYAKALFSGVGSYGYNAAVTSSMVKSYAQNDANKAGTYNQSGAYSSNNMMGSLYDTSF